MPVEHAVGELVRGRGTQFDPGIVDALLVCLRAGELTPLSAGTPSAAAGAS
jgi:HD-GYP domain-containing protein (c-di-GMP phosphodiesterase class II)